MTATDIAEVISDDEIDTLNAARSILADIGRRTGYDRIAGILDVAATTAEHDVFMFLNYLNSHGGREMTYAQMHNQEPVA